LAGRVDQADIATGEVRESYATDTEPGGVLLKACGNRRASVCPACAETYRRDAWQLISAGLRGGKGPPPTRSPRTQGLFVTFTAPSFGAVHTQRHNTRGELLPCRPRDLDKRCVHDRKVGCRQRHGDGERCLGEPVCPGCFDYQAQVLWNALAPELWRRTTEYTCSPKRTPRFEPGWMSCSGRRRNTDGTRPDRRRQRHPQLDSLRVP
jgi:hypothetical protein